jgi:hypothetical protein
MVPPDSALPRIVMSGLAPPMSHSLHSILPVLRRRDGNRWWQALH